MKKIMPLRARRKSEGRKSLLVVNQPRASPHTEDEEGVIALLLNDGTVETISGKNLELDITDKDGVPHLVVRKKSKQ